jgi:hypothetical protein
MKYFCFYVWCVLYVFFIEIPKVGVIWLENYLMLLICWYYFKSEKNVHVKLFQYLAQFTYVNRYFQKWSVSNLYIYIYNLLRRRTFTSDAVNLNHNFRCNLSLNHYH